jgi:CRISPR-associated protein Cas2
MAWLIAYDIADPRRWRRVHAAVTREAWRLQYSLYWAPLGPREIRALAARIEAVIDPRADDVRFYPFPDDAWCRLWGPKPWSEGVSDPFSRRFAPCWRPGRPVAGDGNDW